MLISRPDSIRPCTALAGALALSLCGAACNGWAQASPPTAVPQAQPAAVAAPAPPQATSPTFDIWEFQIDGNTRLPAIEIERAVLPHLGPERTMANVEAARNALEQVYQRAGYLTVFVDIPEQQVSEGSVRLAVLEGRVDRLRVSGAQYHSPGFIRAAVPAAAEGEVPDFNALQAQVARLNTMEDRRVQPVLRPGRVPGTVEVDLQVQDTLPLSGSIELNNQYSRDTEPLRLVGNLRWGNLLQRDHTLSLTAITAPQDTSQSRVGVVNYSIPFDDGAALTAYGVVSDSAVASLGGTTVLGKGLTLGTRWSTPFGDGVGGAGSLHTFSVGADYKDVDETLNFGTETIATPVRYLPMQMAWSGLFSEGSARTQAGATLLWTFRPILQRTVPCPTADGRVARIDQFACKRAGADGGFAVLRLDGRHTRTLGSVFGSGVGPFLGDVSLSLRGLAQVATQPLISAEQMALGGANTVRGYLESEASGDNGLLGSVELRSPNLTRWLGTGWGVGLKDVTALAFADAARVRTLQPLAGQDARAPLAGAGFGLRVSTDSGFDLDFDLARAIKDTAASPAGSHRVHVRLGLRM